LDDDRNEKPKINKEQLSAHEKQAARDLWCDERRRTRRSSLIEEEEVHESQK